MSTLSLRLPNSLHERARELAGREGISINQLIATALAEKRSALMTEEYLEVRARRGSRARYLRALAQVPDVEPEPSDRHSRERPVELRIAPDCRPRTAVFTRHAVHAAAENAPHAFTVGTQASTREFLVQAASRLLEGCLLFRLRTAAQFHHGICQCEHLLHEGPKIRSLECVNRLRCAVRISREQLLHRQPQCEIVRGMIAYRQAKRGAADFVGLGDTAKVSEGHHQV